MTGRFRGPGRRGLRDEVQATWSVYDATRPIRKADLAEPSPPEVATESRDPNRAPPPDEGTTVLLTNPEDAVRFVAATDAELARLFGVTEMDVRESRRWAEEQAKAHPAGIVTVTSIDPATGKVRLQ
jgi:hypothetical protein